MPPTPAMDSVAATSLPSGGTMEGDAPTKYNLSLDGDILEAWAEGYNLGSLVILLLLVFCNYRPRVTLHKLILLELFLASFHSTFIFCNDPTYGWYLSTTATLLFVSYNLHNVISWIKIKPFLPRWGSLLFIGTLVAVVPFWIVEAWSNFEYFNNLGNKANEHTRPWEPLARDPWWIFTTVRLVWIIKRDYSYTFTGLIRTSPRFGIMLLCMILSIVFLVTDFVVTIAHVSQDSGINPYWRLALVFKCASDTIFLDDFKSVLDNIVATSLGRVGGSASGYGSTGRRKSSVAGLRAASMENRPRVGPVVTISTDDKADTDALKVHTSKEISGALPWQRSVSFTQTFPLESPSTPMSSVNAADAEVSNSPSTNMQSKEGPKNPRLQIQTQTTITTRHEPQRFNASRTGSTSTGGQYHDSEETILPMSPGRKMSVDQWGDITDEGDSRVLSSPLRAKLNERGRRF